MTGDDIGDDTALPAGVAWTAVAMAQERAVETDRPDRLFDDPLARAMVDAARAGRQAPDWLAAGTTLGDIAPGMTGYVVARTRWFDEQIMAAGAAQVVLLGAGLDTRTARLTFPHPVTVFCLDQPEVLALAGQVLAGVRPAGPARRVAVPVDLAGDWAAELLRAGFDRDRPTLWVVEGLLMYLSDDEAADIVRRARDLGGAGGSLLADLAHPNIRHNNLFAEGNRTLQGNASPIRSSVADPVAWFAGLGWRADVADPVALARDYARAVCGALDPRPADGPTFQFVAAERR